MVRLVESTVSLVGRIYEATTVPDLWPDVLSSIARNVEAAGASLFTPGGPDARWISSPEMDDDLNAFVAEGWLERDGFNDRLAASGRSGFVGDLDLFAPEELNHEPVYAEWLRPNGFGWGAATMIHLPQGRSLCLNVERRTRRGPMEPDYVAHLNELHPHIVRAAGIASHLSWERRRTGQHALNMVGMPAAILRQGRRVESANPLFEALMPDPVRDCSPRLVLADERANRLLAAALAYAEAGARVAQQVAIPARGQTPPYVLHVLPIRGPARDVFTDCVAMLVVVPLVARPVLAPHVLVDLFELTPAEARVAQRIASGWTVEAIADGLSVSRETIRTQLKAVLAKMGITRQAQLVGLLAGVPGTFDAPGTPREGLHHKE